MSEGHGCCRETEHMSQEIPDRIYSSDESVNRLLNKYYEQADKSRIWFSVDAYGIQPEQYGSGFCEVFGLMLDAAFDECIKTIPPSRRYMKLRSRDAQKRMFIQLTYSSGADRQKEPDQRIVEIGKQITKRNGFFNVRMSGDETSIRFSVPDRKR